MTDSERRRIFGLSKQLGMNNDELHLLINGVTGKYSITELDKHQTYEVIRELSSRASRSSAPVKSSKSAKERKYVPGMITPNQRDYCWSMIYRLAELNPRDASPGERMCGAIKKILGVTADPKDPFKWVSFDEGRDLIEGLKRYVLSAERKAIREGRAVNG